MPEVLAACVATERIQNDLEAVVGFRPPGSVHWGRVQQRCATVFERNGFAVDLHEFPGGVNVIGVRPGVTSPKQRVVIGAHYDHIPGCEGADDNASGVAGVLEVARLLGPTPTDRTVVVACWDREENGLLGSRAWVSGPMRESEAPLVYFNFDAIAFFDSRPHSQRIPTGFGLLFPGQVAKLAEREFRADFIAVVSDQSAGPWAAAFQTHALTLGLPVALLAIPTIVKDWHLAVDLQRSDHASFWNAGVPALMITDTANFRSDVYHCEGGPDALDTLDVDSAADVVAATVFAVATAASDPEQGH